MGDSTYLWRVHPVEISMATYASASSNFISVGDEFSSFVILNEKIGHLQKEQNLSLWKRDSRTINSAVVKGLQRAVNSELVYYSLRYACYHGGRNFKSKSAGQRTNHRLITFYS